MTFRIYVMSTSCEFATRPHRWLINIGSGNGLVPSGNGPLLGMMFTQIYATMWRHWTTMSQLVHETEHIGITNMKMGYTNAMVMWHWLY